MPKNPNKPTKPPKPPRPPKPKPKPVPKAKPKPAPKKTSNSSSYKGKSLPSITKRIAETKAARAPKPGDLANLDKAIKAEMAKRGVKPSDPNAGVLYKKIANDLRAMYSGAQNQKARVVALQGMSKRAAMKLGNMKKPNRSPRKVIAKKFSKNSYK